MGREGHTSWSASDEGGLLAMSSAQQRDAGTTGTTSGYESPASAQAGGYAPAGRHGEHRGAVTGFTALAAILMVLGGLWSVGVGIAGLVHHAFYLPVTNYYFHFNVTGWGWTHVVIGALVVIVGVSVALGQAWARMTGAVLVAISALASFFFMPYSPLWSIAVIVIDLFIMWALLAPRRREEMF